MSNETFTQEASNGAFIVFEGIDGSGTTTQIQRYAEHLRSLRRQVYVTRQPSDGPIGSLLRQGLTGRVELGRHRQAQTMALLFAADRLDHLAAEVDRNLRDGAVVLCDRYDLSSLVYQSATCADGEDDSLRWIKELNRHARRPDATIVLDVTPEVAATRRRHRGQAVELYEADALQRTLSGLYLEAERFVEGDHIVHLNGDGGIDEVHQAIVEALEPIVSRPTTTPA